MSDYDIAPGVAAALARFVVPAKLGFGLVAAPVMFSAECVDGAWRRGQLLPYGPIAVLPGARALQYAELVFKGLKAYRVDQLWPNLFRSLDNCRRMACSAQRLSMPMVPESLFLLALDAVALWLDAAERRYIQELSGMNIFANIGGELHTPNLDGAILPGVTRDSLITLARSMGYSVRERPMPIDELLRQIGSGECSEIFASGTAAIVSPIGALTENDGSVYVPKCIDVVAARMRESLLSIQERRAPDPYGWTRDVARPVP